MIYLDYAANHPVDPAVLARFCAVERAFIGNPNAAHPAGQAAKAEMGRITSSISALLGAQPSEVIYTSGATEANNLALQGLALTGRHTGRHILSTPLEHASVGRCLDHLQAQGYEVDLLQLRPDGTVDLAQLEALLRTDTILVAVCAVDSELGTIQPLRQIQELLKRYPGCRLHVDATQAVGRIPISFSGIDTLSLSLHKLGGLNGSGLLLKRQNLTLAPLFHGGTGASIYRSGTPTLALAAAAECALRLALEQMPARSRCIDARQKQLSAGLSAYPRVTLNTPPSAAAHILNLSVQGVKGTRFQRALSERGVCVSVRSACSTDGAPSRAVFALCQDRRRALCAWRVSLSHLTTASDIQGFLAAFEICYRDLAAADV